MARIALNKSSLQKQREQLRLYERLLPSLDLKRRQLMGEQAKVRHTLRVREEKLRHRLDEIGKKLPMLAYEEIELSGLVRVTRVKVGRENVVGVKLPVLEDVEFEVAEYSMLAKPHWVDNYIEEMMGIAREKAEAVVVRERLKELDHAVRRITQRVNLFEKILIPNAKKMIQRIMIFLGDAERSAVVRSKIAKKINAERRRFLTGEGTA
jgi:V/A-type H+-transporting ATPase subunit D